MDRTKHNAAPARVLAVNLNYLGDALFTTPALAALRARFPHAEIDVLAGARGAAILSGDPAIRRLLVRPPHGGTRRAAALARTLRDARYDAVVLFQSTFTNAILAWGHSVPVRVGFAHDGCAPFLTHPVPARRPGEHVVDAYNRLAAALTGEPVGGAARLSVAVSAADRAFADEFLRDRELPPPVVGLVVGATRPQKRWPEPYFARLADSLWSRYGASSVLLGGPEEAATAARIVETARSPLVSAIGKTTEKQLAALIARLSVVVSGDSGPLHIAAAVGTPVVALFGSTDPAETGPYRAAGSVLYDAFSCAPCRKHPSCGGVFPCLQALTPERTLDAVAPLLGVASRRLALPVLAGAAGAEES